MDMTFGMVVHIAGGGFSLIAGATALIRRKGSEAHKQAGKLFVLSMVMMTLSGAWIAWQESVMVSTLAGLMSFYLLISGWFAIKTKANNIRRDATLLIVLGLSVLVFGLGTVEDALNGNVDHIGSFVVPVAIYATFTAFVALGVIGDAVLIVKPNMARNYILSRHIWRMCIPLYIAATSFFEGQADVFPEAMRHALLLSLPGYAVFLAMLYWLLLPSFRKVKIKAQQWRSRTS
ncbi:MAG: DUF2306 domain-containing protein [Pseudomonadota bacterium]